MNQQIIAEILAKNPNADDWAKVLCEVLPTYEINTNLRLAHFLAQTCHESVNYTRLEESLNYSAEILSKIWPKRFPADMAKKYGRTVTQKANQEVIGNILYGGRMGNAANEGYKYRGRGLIQLTGKDNYKQFSIDSFGNDSIVQNPDQVAKDKKIATHSAAWFWKKNNLNAFADQDNVFVISKKINGGTLGLNERKKLTEEFKKKLCASV